MLLYWGTPLDRCRPRNGILELREHHRRGITEHLGRAAGNGRRVLEQLYEQPIMSVTDVRALIGTTFPGVNQIVQRLVDLNPRGDHRAGPSP
jgi:hypothetical protein